MNQLPETNIQDATTPKKSNRKRSWIKLEDVQLCKSWLHISVDTDETADPMWERIREHFYANIGGYRIEERSTKGMKNRWSNISSTVTRFCEYLSEATERKGSGEDIGQETAEAYRNFSLNSKKNEFFNMDHCWQVLRNEPKWEAVMEKKRKNKEPNIFAQATSASIVEYGSSGSPRPSSHVVSKKAKGIKRKNERNDAVIRFLDRLYVYNEMREKMMQKSLDLKIMTVDISKVKDPRCRRFYKLQQREVLERYEQLSKEEKQEDDDDEVAEEIEEE